MALFPVPYRLSTTEAMGRIGGALQDQNSGEATAEMEGRGGQGWEVVVVPSDCGNGAGELDW
jgi:hypothetical protein